MPQAAVLLDAVQQVVPLNDLASVIRRHCAGR
jgi:chemotaxis response regulator CheB